MHLLGSPQEALLRLPPTCRRTHTLPCFCPPVRPPAACRLPQEREAAGPAVRREEVRLRQESLRRLRAQEAALAGPLPGEGAGCFCARHLGGRLRLDASPAPLIRLAPCDPWQRERRSALLLQPSNTNSPAKPCGAACPPAGTGAGHEAAAAALHSHPITITPEGSPRSWAGSYSGDEQWGAGPSQAAQGAGSDSSPKSPLGRSRLGM